MTHMPLLISVENRKCLLTGGGAVATRRCKTMLEYGASVTIIAREATPEIRNLAENNKVTLISRSLKLPEDISQDYWLVICATDDSELNNKTAQLCRKLKILVNVTNDGPASDIVFPAVRNRGLLTVAISTGGADPALASRLAEQTAAAWPPDIEEELERKLERRHLKNSDKQAKNIDEEQK
jgi:siroheme synthase-like protein